LSFGELLSLKWQSARQSAKGREKKPSPKAGKQTGNDNVRFIVPCHVLPTVDIFCDNLARLCKLFTASLGWLGVTLILLALLVFWRSHADLGLNWSPSLEIRTEHKLITNGIFGYIRHPMYASQWIWVIAQPLLIQNWIAGFLNLLVFIAFYFLRVSAEEKMMLDIFGDEYREYMNKTGAVIPKGK